MAEEVASEKTLYMVAYFLGFDERTQYVTFFVRDQSGRGPVWKRISRAGLPVIFPLFFLCKALVKSRFFIDFRHRELDAQAGDFYRIIMCEIAHSPILCLTPVELYSHHLRVDEEYFLNCGNALVQIRFDASVTGFCARREHFSNHTGIAE